MQKLMGRGVFACVATCDVFVPIPRSHRLVVVEGLILPVDVSALFFLSIFAINGSSH